MEKGLKWLFGGLIAAVILMFILMVGNADAQVRFGDGEHGYWQAPSYYNYEMTVPLYVLTPTVDKNTTSSSQNFINNSVTRGNEYRPNVTVNTPKPQR